MKKRVYLPVLFVSCMMLLSVLSFGRGHIPVTSSNLSNDTVCSGTVVNLVFGAGDTTAADPLSTTYSWQLSTNGGVLWSVLSSGGGITITDSLLSFTATSAFTGYVFRCIATDSLGSDTSNAAVVVVDTAYGGTITGPSSVCVGSQITLAGAIYGGTWIASNDTASVSFTGVVTGLLSNDSLSGGDTVYYGGLDTIYYYIVNVCGSFMDTALITVNPLPQTGVISGPSAVCKTSTISLSETVAGGVWSRSNPTVDSVSVAGVVRGISQGFDTIKYTTNNGLCSAYASHPVRVDTTVIALPVTGPTTGCVGHTIVLMDANVYGTWTWTATNSHASISSSGSVFGISGGLDTFSYSFSNSCISDVISSTTVMIDTILNPGVISGGSAVCAGSWIHLSESLATGIWISSNSLQAIVDGSGNVTGVSAGAPVISYVVSNGCGDIAATHVVTVQIPASTITGPDSVGLLATIALSDSASGGSWTISSPTIANINTSGIVTGESTGYAIVTYTVTNACGTSSATETIYVGPPPYVSVITGPDSVCLGTTIQLTDTVAGGTWSSSNGDSLVTLSSVGDSSVNVTGVSYGMVTVTYIVHNAFGYDTSYTSVFVNAPPVVAINGPSIISLGGNYFLPAYPADGTFSLSNETVGNIVSTADYDSAIVISAGDTLHNVPVTYCSFVIVSAGIDTITYTATNTCGTRRTYFVIDLSIVNHTPVIVGSSDLLNVYPNPNNGEFTINLSSVNSEHVAVSVTNLIGQKVQDVDITTNKNYDIRLDQPSGVYLLTAVTADGSRYTSKITLTR